MPMYRREFVALAAATTANARSTANTTEMYGRPTGEMYGLIGKMTATPGKRDALIAILAEGINNMPGCLSYIVAKDTTDADSLWITEVWDSKASHDRSLSLPAVRAAIAKAKPIIAAFGDAVITTPIAGHGLPSANR